MWNTSELMKDLHQVGRSQLSPTESVKDSNRMKGKKFPLDLSNQKVSDENSKSELISVLVELWLAKTGMES